MLGIVGRAPSVLLRHASGCGVARRCGAGAARDIGCAFPAGARCTSRARRGAVGLSRPLGATCVPFCGHRSRCHLRSPRPPPRRGKNIRRRVSAPRPVLRRMPAPAGGGSSSGGGGGALLQQSPARAAAGQHRRLHRRQQQRRPPSDAASVGFSTQTYEARDGCGVAPVPPKPVRGSAAQPGDDEAARTRRQARVVPAARRAPSRIDADAAEYELLTRAPAPLARRAAVALQASATWGGAASGLAPLRAG